ncbi:hypothetical protein QBC34DRAFT_375368 [Podospora aff. communis PSN243]|uniref:Uncharacterized protein n=1 Tax=Podospora aff. communis PSN243 TaxID=3040156 RepID=A0AAV9H0Q4_9PEZI|nr:hypothetical protein QBC34DRAFT_375368 [Podospora aff. communis PSN243]
MVALSRLWLVALLAPASCRLLLRSQLQGLTGGDFSDPNYVSLKPTIYPPLTNLPLSISWKSAPSSTPPPALELAAARRALAKIKALLGQDALKKLFADEIAAGHKTWHDLLTVATDDNNSADPGTRTVASIQFTAIPKDCTDAAATKFTAGSYIAWFAGAAFHNIDRLWAGHPEHYGIRIGSNSDGTLGANVTEPWGNVLTDAYVPSLMPVTGKPGGGVRKPWMQLKDEFPYQSVGEETLQDGSGTVIGYLHYSFRDVPAKGKSGKTCGIEVALDIWMPSHTPDEIRDGIANHLKVEYYNWVAWAFDDIKSGAFVPA